MLGAPGPSLLGTRDSKLQTLGGPGALRLGSRDNIHTMLLELGKAVSLILSILSLYPVMLSAFFVPGTRWEDRLALSLLKIASAACICFASGLLFAMSPRPSLRSFSAVFSTLPVRLFLWAMAAMSVLFVVSWYIEEYYVPLLWRNQP
jgi:hypothetical protein